MRRLVLLFGLLVISASSLALALPPHPPPAISAQVTGVIDGGTFHATILSVQEGSVPTSSVQTGSAATLAEWTDVVVQYIGIATPAPGDPFGPDARAANEAMVGGRIVYLELDRTLWTTTDNQLLAYVYLDPAGNVMVNAVLVAQGIADAKSDAVNIRYDDVLASLAQAAAQTCLVKNMLTSPCLAPDILGENDSGKTVILGVGAELVVELAGIPSTGYNWERTAPLLGFVLVPLEEATFKADASWVMGSPGVLTFRYQAATSGTTPLSLAYKRPGSADVLRTFSVTVIVR